MFKKGSSLGELFGIKQGQGRGQQQQQQQNDVDNSNSTASRSAHHQTHQHHQGTPSSPSTMTMVPSSIQDLAKVYDRAKDLLDKTRQRNQIGFEENNPDIEKRQFARINEIRRLTNAMKMSINSATKMFEDVNEKMAWEQQVKYFEEDLESAVDVAVTSTPKSSMFVGTNVASNTPESTFSPPVNDLRTPPPVATTAPPVVDLFAGLNVTPTPAASMPPPSPPPPPLKEEKQVIEEKQEIDFERMMPPVQTPEMEITTTTTTTTTETTVEDDDEKLDDDNKAGYLPRGEEEAEEAEEIPFVEEEEHQQGGLTSGLDDALDESDEYLEDFSSSTQMHEAVVSPPAVVKRHPVIPGIKKVAASANPTMLRIPSFSMEDEDVPIGDSPGAKRFQQTTKFAQEVEAAVAASKEKEAEEKTKVSSIEQIANAIEVDRDFSARSSPDDDSLEVGTPVLTPSRHSYTSGGGVSASVRKESFSEPFTPVYSRVTTPTLELSPDEIARSPGSPMVILNSQDQDFVLQNYGIQKVALDFENADEVDKVLEGAESFVRTCRLTWENAQRLKMAASNQRLSSATKATQHLVRKSELQKQQDEAIRNDDFEVAANIEEKLDTVSKEFKNAEDSLNAAELEHAERVRASLSALNAWANAEIEASNIIDKFVSDKEEKWAQEKAEEEAKMKTAVAEVASTNNASSEQERLVLRATETEDALKLAMEKSRENEAKMNQIEEKRKAAELKVNELKEKLKTAESELDCFSDEVALESANAEKANQFAMLCQERHDASKVELEAYNEKVREEAHKEAQKQQEQVNKSSEIKELISKIKERSELYRRSGSGRLQSAEESSVSDDLQQLITHETMSTILSSEACSELKREESDSARINSDIAKERLQENDCLSRMNVLERRKNELLSLKQTHVAAKSFKEASECVNTLNVEVLPELEQVSTALSQKKKNIENLQLQSTTSETNVRECREKFREAEKICARTRKLRLQTELKTKNDAEDESEVKALKAALELLTLKHPEV